MIFGIKYYSNAGAIIFNGECNMLFANPIVAQRVVNYLSKKNNIFKYKVYKLSKDEKYKEEELPLIKSFKEYKQYIKESSDNVSIVLSEKDEYDLEM